MSRKRCNTVFTLAYNRAHDFRYFQRFLKLPPHALYYPPACLKRELYEFLDVLEHDQQAYIEGKMTFQPDIEVNTLDDIESQTQSNYSPYDVLDGNKTVLKCTLDICDDCEKSRYDCHYKIFAEYCYAHVMRSFELYPMAMTEDATRRVYLQWYNSALHFMTWERSFIYLRHFVVLPPRCLERSMEDDVRIIKQKREEYIKANPKEKIYEHIETSMDFDGMEMKE